MGKEASTIYSELIPISIEIGQIYLDPNNPRFISMEWNEIPNEKIDDTDIQSITQQRLEEDFSINKLMQSIETNGFLNIDRVIVKEFKPNKFVVLEGNRRICAAKIIKKRYESNADTINEEVIKSLQLIDCLQYTGEEQQPAWIFQGLRHITGIYDWSSFNKAKLLVKLMEDESLNLADVGKKFGLSAYGAGQWVRGYYAYKRASEESDYTREVTERLYPYCQELFGRSNTALREWLKWDEVNYRFNDELHFNEFLSWLYPRNDEEELDGVDSLGDWSRKIIGKSSDLRTISYLLKESPVEFEAFRSEGDLEKAYNTASMKKIINQTDPSEEAFNNIKACVKSLENLPFRIIINQRDYLSTLIDKLEKALGDIKEVCRQEMKE